MEQQIWSFETEPCDRPQDETDINLRAYFDRMPDEKMKLYSSAWTDDQVIEWDDNFRDDGFLFLPCSEREVDIAEYRQVIEECIRYRARVRSSRAS